MHSKPGQGRDLDGLTEDLLISDPYIKLSVAETKACFRESKVVKQIGVTQSLLVLSVIISPPLLVRALV